MTATPFQPKSLIFGLLLTGVLLFDGCAKKVAVVKPPQPPAPVINPTPVAKPAELRRAPEPARAPAIASTRPSAVPDQATRDRIQTLLDRIQDAYFDYNTSNIRADAQAALRTDAQTLAEILRGYPGYKLTIQGFADERGSAEYNLGLGDARAKRAFQFLVDSGIPATQLVTVSFGKERQVCSEHEESCWQKNRRIHITQAQT
jgi:peptidoglycan-associated lipoprotein